MKPALYVGIAILLSINNIFINYKIGPIGYDRLIEFAIFGLFLKSYIIELQTNSFFRKYNLFILTLAILQVLMNIKMVAFNGLDSETIYISFFKCISFIVFSYLFYLIAKEDLKYLRLIIYIHLAICVFALLQHPLSPFSSEIHDIKASLYSGMENDPSLMKNLNNQELYIDLGISNRFRLSGPFPSSITFSYFLLSTFFLNLYMYFRTEKRFYQFTLGIIFLCSLLSQTRSLVLAELTIILGVFAIVHNVKFNSYKIIITITALILSMVYIDNIENAFSSGENSRLTKLKDEGNRPLLWLTGINAVANHPFGVTDKQYDNVKQRMYNRYGKESILYLPCHNGLINTGFNYTAFGYVVIIYFFIFLVNGASALSRNYKYLFYLFFVAYMIQSFFHNNFIFYSDYNVMMVVMLIPLHMLYENLEKESRIPHH